MRILEEEEEEDYEEERKTTTKKRDNFLETKRKICPLRVGGWGVPNESWGT